MKSFTDQKVLIARQKAKRLRMVFLVFALVTMCDILTIALLQYAGIITERQKLLVFLVLVGLASPLGVVLAIVCARAESRAKNR